MKEASYQIQVKHNRSDSWESPGALLPELCSVALKIHAYGVSEKLAQRLKMDKVGFWAQVYDESFKEIRIISTKEFSPLEYSYKEWQKLSKRNEPRNSDI